MDEVDVQDNGAEVFKGDMFFVSGIDSEDFEHDELDFSTGEAEDV